MVIPTGTGAVVARTTAALAGGHALTYLASAACALWLPYPPVDLVFLTGSLCFLLHAAVAVWAFAARTALEAWCLILALAAMIGIPALMSGGPA